jgi:hypothetical protein
VYEGAEEKLKQLGTGLLEKLGVGGPSWEQEERERYRLNMVPVENQLAAGQPTAQEQQRRIQPATTRSFEPDEAYDYVEVDERREREPLRQRRYLDEEPLRDERPRNPQPAPGGRRYIRDDGPLDVEPLDYDSPAPRRRDLGNDPW